MVIIICFYFQNGCIQRIFEVFEQIWIINHFFVYLWYQFSFLMNIISIERNNAQIYPFMQCIFSVYTSFRVYATIASLQRNNDPENTPSHCRISIPEFPRFPSPMEARIPDVGATELSFRKTLCGKSNRLTNEVQIEFF